MQLELKGVHTVKKRLSDGRTAIYYYAWRGGPRLEGDPGTKVLWGLFNAATDVRPVEPIGETLSDLIELYRKSANFTQKAPRTRKDYERPLLVIDRKWGHAPLLAVEHPDFRGDALAWRDQLAATPRAADSLWVMLATVLSFGVDRRKLTTNQGAKGGRLHKADRAELVWSEAEIAALLDAASPAVADALLFALWTGARQGDVLGRTWSNHVDAKLRKRTNKRGAFVSLPVGGPLRAMLDTRQAQRETTQEALRREGKPAFGQTTILVNSRGAPWTTDGFKTSWGKMVKAAVAAARRGRGEQARPVVHRRPDVQRSARHCGHAACARRLQRGGDRQYHRPQLGHGVAAP